MAKRKINFKKISRQFKPVFKEAYALFVRSFSKTVFYQLLFKTAYLSIIIVILTAVFNLLFDFLKTILLNDFLKTSEIEADLIKLQALFFFCLMIAVILLGRYIEKNGLIIITAYYYRFENISFLRTLIKATRKTPAIIYTKIKELGIIFFLVPALFIFWLVILFFGENNKQFFFLTVVLLLAIVGLALTVYIKNIYSSYVVALESNESSLEFNKNVSRNSAFLRIAIISLWYLMFGSIILSLFFGIFYLLKILFNLAITSFISPAFLLSFATVSITFLIIILPTILSSFKMSLYTVLYYKERKKQAKKIKLFDENQFRFSFLAKWKMCYVFLLILSLLIVVGFFLSSFFQEKFDSLESKTQNKNIEISADNGLLKEIATEIVSSDESVFFSTANVLFIYFANQ